ncbi:MAG TPA: DUF2997 domain-containing protein [Clostridia bacterium]|nr:DUF2997 domain-containing protein [Clostridia bacterium]
MVFKAAYGSRGVLGLAREVRVKIDASGHVEMDFLGFEGTECLNEAEALEEALRQFGIALSRNAVRPKPELSGAGAFVPRSNPQRRQVGEDF